MAKLERVTAKIFASDAPADKIGQFGSALAGTKLETGDVSTIQALSAFTEGWSSAVISQRNYPVLQETNGVMKNMSYQTAYIMQNGIAEYDPDTEYCTGSLCKGIGNTNQYASWGDENVGNAVTNSDYWKNVTPVNYSNITNCLLENPQRIKYDLTDGTLTIKAGSVVIFPYRTEDLSSTYPVGATFMNDNCKVYDTQFVDGKFFVWVEIQADITRLHTTTSNELRFLYFIIDTENISFTTLANSESGTSATASQGYTIYYNTSTNSVGTCQSSTTIKYEALTSLPMMKTQSNGSIMYSSIDQVFNGIGYIGSTIWIDKGIKGLIPNRRNKDGSLNNIEWTNDKIRTTSGTSTGKFELVYKLSNDLFEMNKPVNWSFNEDKNIYVYTDGTEYRLITLGDVNLEAGTITYFNPKQPFKAIDYSDKSTVSGWGMPSSKFTNLTLGASGTLYTAPANGWFSVYSTTTMNGMFNYEKFGGATGVTFAFYSSLGGRGMLPVLKGDVVKFSYTGTPTGIRFIYAEGEV